MKSTFSTQKRQTFFLRKYCRLPRRGGPPPPGPEGRPSRGPPEGPEGRGADCCSLMVMISTFSWIEFPWASWPPPAAPTPGRLQEELPEWAPGLQQACAAGDARDVRDAPPASAAA